MLAYGVWCDAGENVQKFHVRSVGWVVVLEPPHSYDACLFRAPQLRKAKSTVHRYSKGVPLKSFLEEDIILVVPQLWLLRLSKYYCLLSWSIYCALNRRACSLELMRDIRKLSYVVYKL
jgi:hypothetical protein